MKKGVSNAEMVVRLITESDLNDSCREDLKKRFTLFFSVNWQVSYFFHLNINRQIYSRNRNCNHFTRISNNLQYLIHRTCFC